MESLDENKVYRIEKGRVLDDDDEPVKDVVAVGLQNLVEGNKNPLSDYNEAFRNLQTRRRMKPVTSGLAKEETGATEINSVTLHSTTDIQVPQQQEGASELAAEMAERMESSDSEAEDAVDNDGPEPTFATIGADDVALDMDTEFGYITEDDLNGESEDDDLDDSMY